MHFGSVEVIVAVVEVGRKGEITRLLSPKNNKPLLARFMTIIAFAGVLVYMNSKQSSVWSRE